MDRRGAYFTDSRLYRQSSELSVSLLQHDLPEEPLQALHRIAFEGISKFVISQPRQLDRPIRQLSKHLNKLARQASAYQFIPALHEAVPKFYRDNIGADRPWIGGALKLAAGSLWTEMMAERAIGSRNQQALVDLVIAGGALDQMLIVKQLMSSTVGDGELIYEDSQLEWNDAFEMARKRFNRAFYRRGKVQRSSSLLNKALFEGEGVLTRLAFLRLSGSLEPVSGYPEELFEVISRVTDRDFWAGVWARLSLVSLASEVRGALCPEDVVGGIAVLEQTAVASPMGQASTLAVQDNILGLFWRRDWQRGLDLFDLRKAFVERPVMRIDRMREVFVTSVFTIFDSLTSYFEDMTFDLQTDKRFGRTESVYKALFSRPFEDEIENFLRSRNFRAGHVSDAGAWSTQTGTVDLRKVAGSAPPGEIDVLAIGSEGRSLVVECKCLKLPHNESRLQTLLGGLGEEDAAGYLRKVSNKAAWARKLSLGGEPHEVMSVLVTDYPINFRSWQAGDVIIVDAELLPALLDSYLEHS